MSHPQPPQRQPSVIDTVKYAKALHNTAIICLVACPLLALVPPRKLDLFTFGLAGGTVFSASYLVRESTGRSLIDHLTNGNMGVSQQSELVAVESTALQDQIRQRRQEDLRASHASIARPHASQDQSWVRNQHEEVKEALEEGKGFGDMIMDRIWDVWNWGKKDDDDD